MSDALAGFDFNQVSGSGLFLKWEAGKPVKLRILTTDPLVFLDKFGNTRFAFTVYNLTEGKAQILQASPGMARRIGELHTDDDFGANIRGIDIKITPTGDGMERRYTIDPITMNVRDLTSAEIKEASEINLEEKVAKDAPLAQRMSFYDSKKFNEAKGSLTSDATDETASGYEQAKAVASALGGKVEEDIDAPIDLNDIPF